MGRLLRGRGKLLMGNGVFEAEAFAAYALDIVGSELRMGSALGDEERLAFYRSVAFRKPVAHLLYEGWDSEERVAALWKRAMLYGFFAASASQTSRHGVSALEERYRRRYAPALVRLLEAGWEPVTGVRASDPAVRLERYGQGPEFYLVVWNAGREAREVSFEPDPTVLAWPPDARAEDALEGDTYGQSRALVGGGGVRLAADELRVLRFTAG